MPAHVFHVGYPKAASTYLQQWFEAHPAVRYRPFGIAGHHGTWGFLADVPLQAEPPPCAVTSDERFVFPVTHDAIGLNADGRVWASGAWVAEQQARVCAGLHALRPESRVLVVTRGFAGIIRSTYTQYLRLGAPGLAGNVALMPLPRWTPQGPPTAGWGATMLAIPRGVEDRAAAAELLAFVAASPEVIAGRTRSSDMMPPLADTSVESGDDPFYVTGPPRRLFAELAPFVDLPPSDAKFLRKAANLGLALEATTADLEAGEPEAAVRIRLEDRLANPL